MLNCIVLPTGMLGGTLISKLGRKFSMFIITVLFGGRLVTGFGTGITTIAVPVYVSEIASPDVRGMLGSFFQVRFLHYDA